MSRLYNLKVKIFFYLRNFLFPISSAILLLFSNSISSLAQNLSPIEQISRVIDPNFDPVISQWESVMTLYYDKNQPALHELSNIIEQLNSIDGITIQTTDLLADSRSAILFSNSPSELEKGLGDNLIRGMLSEPDTDLEGVYQLFDNTDCLLHLYSRSGLIERSIATININTDSQRAFICASSHILYSLGLWHIAESSDMGYWYNEEMQTIRDDSLFALSCLYKIRLSRALIVSDYRKLMIRENLLECISE